MHDTGHPHDHAHSHDHQHAHDHAHSHGGFESIEQAEALMKYMLEHNRHHAEELHQVCHKLEDMGHASAAMQLGCALSAYNEGNDRLEQALKSLREV